MCLLAKHCQIIICHLDGTTVSSVRCVVIDTLALEGHRHVHASSWLQRYLVEDACRWLGVTAPRPKFSSMIKGITPSNSSH